MFNFIRDAVAVYKIRSVMGKEANWISEVEFPNVQIGSILPVIVATFPSGDIRSIHCYRNDRPKVMDKFVEAGISVVAADLEVVSLRSGKIEGFKPIPDYNTKVTFHKLPSVCEYLRLNSILKDLSSRVQMEFVGIGKIRNAQIGDVHNHLRIIHPSGAYSSRIIRCPSLEYQPVLLESDLAFLKEAGYDVRVTRAKVTDVHKGRILAVTHN